MAVEGGKKVRFNRTYTGYNPNPWVGPTCNVLDTIVIPVDVVSEDDGTVRNSEEQVFQNLYTLKS